MGHTMSLSEVQMRHVLFLPRSPGNNTQQLAGEVSVAAGLSAEQRRLNNAGQSQT